MKFTTFFFIFLYFSDGQVNTSDPTVVKNKDVKTRDLTIVRNKDAKLGEFPFQVSLNTDKAGHFCSGAILSSKRILSTAQCLDAHPLSQIKIFVGSVDLSSHSNPYSIEMVDYRENYLNEFNSVIEDIAVMKIRETIEFNNYTGSVSLPKFNETIPAGSPVIASNWIQLFNNLTYGSTILQKGKVYIQNEDECKSYVENNVMYKNTICTNHQNGKKGNCGFDPGSLLTTETGKLIGLFSWVAKSEGCKYSKNPNVYVQVSKYVDWIKEILNK